MEYQAIDDSVFFTMKKVSRYLRSDVDLICTRLNSTLIGYAQQDYIKGSFNEIHFKCKEDLKF